METVPIQSVVAICTGLLAIIGALNLAYLAKMLQEIKDLKEADKLLEVKMEKADNTKVSKDTYDANFKLLVRELEPLKQMQLDIASIKTSVAISEALEKERSK